jgi:hypothetical protein
LERIMAMDEGARGAPLWEGMEGSWSNVDPRGAREVRARGPDRN